MLDAYGLTGLAQVSSNSRLGNAAMQLGTDLVFRCPTVAVAKALSTKGNAVWQYQFDYAASGATVNHGSEVSYIFNKPKPGEPPLRAYRINFVRRRDPNGDGLPRWPRHQQDGKSYLSIEQTGPAVANDLRGAVCGPREVP